MLAKWHWRIPPSLLVVVALYLALAGTYLAIVPALAGFDSIAHHNYVNYLRKYQRFAVINSESANFSYELTVQPPLYYFLAAVASAGLPYENADGYTNQSLNAYFGGLSSRWSIDLPDAPPSFRGSVLLARLLSLCGGLVAVIGTWLWVNALAAKNPWFAAVVASLVGFNSLFLFLSTTITNDAWSVAGAVVPMWLITAAVKQPNFSFSRWFVVGCGCGLAALTKYSALLVAIAALAVLIFEYRRVGLRRFIYTVLLIGTGGIFIAGFWYLRNWALYHELIPMAQAAAVIPSLNLAIPMNFDQIVAKLPWLYSTYWGVYGAIFPPQGFYRFWDYFTWIAWLGVVVSLVRSQSRKQWLLPIVYSLLWFVPAFAGVIHWMRTVAFADHARFLMPASPAIALLLLIGWQQFVPEQWRKSLNMTLIALFALIALWPVPTLAEEFAIPAAVADSVQPTEEFQATFLNEFSLLGVTFPAGKTILPNQKLAIELYFKAEKAIPNDYTLFLHLFDADNNLLYQFDGVPDQGRHPTRQWRPGETFVDSYAIFSDLPVADQLVTLSLGFYKRSSPEQRLPVYQPNGDLIGDRLILGKLRVLATVPTIQPLVTQSLAVWDNGIHLISQTLKSDSQQNLYQIATEWQTTQPLQADYKLFLQLLKGDQLVAQLDQAPAGEQLPTSTWLVNERIASLYEIALPKAGWDKMIVGFYNERTGERVLLAEPNQQEDFFTLQSQ